MEVTVDDEEHRVLFAAAEQGRADIINTVVEALTAKYAATVLRATTEASWQASDTAANSREALISMPRASDGASPLHVASMNGHVDATRALLRLGAAPQTVGTGPLQGKTPWDVALAAVREVYAYELVQQVAIGDKGKVLRLLKAGVPPYATGAGERGDAPLHWAASFGRVSMCALLLEEGAHVNHRNREGATALHEASKGGHAEVVRLLLGRDADPEIVGTGGDVNGKIPAQVSTNDAVTGVFVARFPSLHRPKLMSGAIPYTSAEDGISGHVLRQEHTVNGHRPEQQIQPPTSPHPLPAETKGNMPPFETGGGVQHGENADRGSAAQSDDERNGEGRSERLAIQQRGSFERQDGADDLSRDGHRPVKNSRDVRAAIATQFPLQADVRPARNNRTHEIDGMENQGNREIETLRNVSSASAFGPTSAGFESGHEHRDSQGRRRAPWSEDTMPHNNLDHRRHGGNDGVRGCEIGDYRIKSVGHSAGSESNREDVGVGDIGGGAHPLPLLWPPPKICTVLLDELCRIPARVVVVLPFGGIGRPRTQTLDVLTSALEAVGVSARFTRARCAPGRGDDFFINLSCGRRRGASTDDGRGQGFSLVAGGGMIRVAGKGDAGLYYGVCTLAQLLRMYATSEEACVRLDNGAVAAVAAIPCCIIRDEPDIARRSLVVDVRYPLVPSLPSLFKTVERASRFRINVLHLAVTLETACWLTANECGETGGVNGREDSFTVDGGANVHYAGRSTQEPSMEPTSRRRSFFTSGSTAAMAAHSSTGEEERNESKSAVSSRAREEGSRARHNVFGRKTSSDAGYAEEGGNVSAKDGGQVGGWGWGTLGELEDFCTEHFVELVPCWTIVPGNESREAQRATLQMLSSFSRQFQSDEIHFSFADGVNLAWEGKSTTADASPLRPPAESTTAVPAENGCPHEQGHGTGRQQMNELQHADDGGHDPPRGLGDVMARGESKEEGESTASPGVAVEAAPGTASAQDELSLTRVLSNLVVACNQGTVVLDGVPPPAINSLQGVGYLPVEMAFTIEADALGAQSAVEALSFDGVVEGVPEKLSMLLGPAYLGYVRAGRGGSPQERIEQTCLSMHDAFAEISKAVDLARRTGCGVKVVPPSGLNPYYPALLSEALTVFGAGLCWAHEKASAALEVAPTSGVPSKRSTSNHERCDSCPRGTHREGDGVDLAVFTSEDPRRPASGQPKGFPRRTQYSSSRGGVASDRDDARQRHRRTSIEALGVDAGGGPYTDQIEQNEENERRGEGTFVGLRGEASSLWALADFSSLMMEHVLRIGDRELKPDAAAKLKHCLRMLSESWLVGSAGFLGETQQAKAVRQVDAVLWGMHDVTEHNRQRLSLHGQSRLVLRTLQRRHFDLQEAATAAAEGLQTSPAFHSGESVALLEEIARIARLLKLSGRVLQTVAFHFLGPDTGGERVRRSPDGIGDSSVPTERSPILPSLNEAGTEETRSLSQQPPTVGSRIDDGISIEGSRVEGTFQQLVAAMPSSARFDAANRYFEEFRTLAMAWDSASRLDFGKGVLYDSLHGLLGVLAHDISASQVIALCRRAIYE